MTPCASPSPTTVWRHLAAGGVACLLPAFALAARVEFTVLDAQRHPLDDAVVSVEVKGTKATAAAGTQVEMAQRNRRFAPEVLAIQTGTSVQFPNFDTVRHHVYSFSAARQFEIKLYAGTPAAPVAFEQAGTAVLGCNIHDRMTGFVHVVNTPHFAKTSPTGTAQLDLPAGEHTVQVWHPTFADTRSPLRQPLKVAASGVQSVTLTLPAQSVSAPPGK